MKQFVLFRYEYKEDQTNGLLFIDGIYTADTIEKPWKGNAHNISCIPKGVYPLTAYDSPHNKRCLLLSNVPDRSMIEIHAGNKVTETDGCILVGIRTSGILIVSRATLTTVLGILGTDEGTIEIKGTEIL